MVSDDGQIRPRTQESIMAELLAEINERFWRSKAKSDAVYFWLEARNKENVVVNRFATWAFQREFQKLSESQKEIVQNN